MIIVVLPAIRALCGRMRRSPKGTVSAVLALCFALSATAGSSQSVDASYEAINALKESYALGRKLHGQERISYLVELTGVSGDVDPDSTRRWCEELFTLASRSPLDWDHVASQKNAAVSLGPVDPMRAMDLLAKVDVPQPDEDGRFPEDVRADAAAHIFPWFWRAYGMKKLAQIQFQAIDIGDTGEYPYWAMAGIIDHLVDLNSQDASVQAEGIFRVALRYYGKQSRFSNDDEEFLDMLGSAKRIGAPDTYREGLQLFIARVSAPGSGDGAYASNVRTAQGIVRLHDRNEQLLWRVLPLVMAFDPAWGQRLISERPELEQAQGGVVPLGATYIHDKHSAQDVQQRQQLLLEKALLPRIATLNETDPQAALQMALSLTTLPTRITGIATVLPGVKRSDPIQATQLYDQQLRNLELVQDPQERLQALVAIAKSAFAMQDLETLLARTKEAMDTGTLLFEKDSKKRRAQVRSGYFEVGEIVEFGVQHHIDWVVAAVKHTRVRLLKAHLLIFVAKGMLERKAVSGTRRKVSGDNARTLPAGGLEQPAELMRFAGTIGPPEWKQRVH